MSYWKWLCDELKQLIIKAYDGVKLSLGLTVIVFCIVSLFIFPFITFNIYEPFRSILFLGYILMIFFGMTHLIYEMENDAK